ncbi:hypothetical protein DC31_13755 [Microbacterium sp. CH12i]|uniref:hypothetical protein n=1 Tax=Microbacterium sp. CH12i TaxID=1479651 RepID=UPI0004619B5C|nr:hypothetical protein [Microbacterium sp. CH12i]KDA05847.1 hypothetical protein DC31_13755 [Microbacterium sp. CH12i]
MEIAALFIAIISALGTGAAAIMAWVSRADALAAKESAEAAEAAAVDAWKRAADALEEANSIQLRTTAEAISRERLIRRTEIGEAACHMFSQDCLRTAVGGLKDPERPKAKRELMLRVTGTGEPAAFMFLTLLDRAKDTVARGDFESSTAAVARCFTLTREWVADPDEFEHLHRSEISVDDLAEDIRKAAEAFEAVMRADPSS